MSADFDPLDVANAALVDRLILRVREVQDKAGRRLTNDDLLQMLARVYGIPDDPDAEAGPVLALAAELLLRLVNAPVPEPEL